MQKKIEKKPKELSPLEEKINRWVENHLARVPFVQKMLFVHNLQIMIKAGLPIVSALKILTEQIENKPLRRVIGLVKQQVEKGDELSKALGGYPHIFPTIYVSMIAAGESSGKMEEALANVHLQMQKSHELTSRVRGALIYPAVILTAMVGIGVEMVVFVLPKIVVMFDEFHTQLPAPTKILIGTVKFFQFHGLAALIGTVVGIVFIAWLIKKPVVRFQLHRFYLRVPIFGKIIKQINLARFTLTLSSLLNSALPIIEAVKISGNVQTNLVYREAIWQASEALKKGDALSEILQQEPHLFPPMVTEMTLVGEQAGQLEHMLRELADYYGNEVDATMRNFSTIIEPVLILTMGVAVGGMAIAIIMPMYALAQSF